MNTSSLPTDPWWEDRVEAYVDGTLDPDEYARFTSLLEQNEEIAAQIELASMIRDGFQSFERVDCPDSITVAIGRTVRAEIFRDWLKNIGESVRSYAGLLTRPALAMAVLLTIVLASVLTSPSANRTPEPAVVEALEDIKWTLAYLSRVTQQTGSTVRSEAIEPLVIGRMHDAINTFTNN